MNDANAATFWWMLSFVATSLLLIGLSIPMLLRRVKPNRWYGFRTPKTLSNDKIWYESNGYSGKRLLVFSTIHTITSLVLYLIPALGTNLTAYASAVGVIFFIGFTVVIVQSFHYLRTL